MTGFETRKADWLSLKQALHRILKATSPLDTEEVEISKSLGRILAVDITAPTQKPLWETSAMDGYAVHSQDVSGANSSEPVRLEVIGVVFPGNNSDRKVSRGQAIRIMTGGPIPIGADTVIRVEDTDREQKNPGQIIIYSDRDQKKHVRPAAEDWTQGDTILKSGTGIGPGQIGVLASARATKILVHRKPLVAILANGNELQDIETQHPQPNLIPESNSHVVATATHLAGGIPLRLGIARDNPKEIRDNIEKAREADVLVTLGGASMGEEDLFKRVLDDLGFRLDFWRVKIRPGSPTSFGHLPRNDISDQPVFGIPGNPTSAFVSFEIFVRPFLMALSGSTRINRTVISAYATEDLSAAESITGFLLVKLTHNADITEVSLAGPQGSGLVKSLGAADGLAVIPEGTHTICQGSSVDVILFDKSY